LIKTLQATDNDFFTDHIIGGNKVLPTVCAMAWMANAAESLCPDHYYIGLKNYKLFKGVVFDGTEASTYNIDLNSKNNEGDCSDNLVLETKISSVNNNGKTVFHYAAEIILQRNKAVAPKLTDANVINTTAEINEQQIDAARELYGNGTLFHGESLQGINAVLQCDDDGLLLACQVPEIAVDKAGQFPLTVHNIFANDLIYQAMLVWVRKQLAMGSLPSTTLQWTTYRQVKISEQFYLKLTVVEQTGSKLIADISLISTDNELLAEIKSAEVTVSENLNQLFAVSTENSTNVEAASISGL